MAKATGLQFLTKSFFNRIFLTLIPFVVLVAVIYTLLISFSLLYVEDYVLHSYLNQELEEIRNKISKNGENTILPSTSYLDAYWENDSELPVNFKQLEVGTHESLDSEYHILVGDIPGIKQKIYLVLDEDKVSSFEQYVDVIDVTLWLIALLVIFSSITVAYFIARMIANPVSKLAFDVRDELYPNKQFHGAERNDEIGKLSRSFSALVNQLQNSLDIEKSFTQHSSHEMRTPLAVIRNAVSVLSLPNCSEEKKLRNIARIEQACKDSDRMLDVFLTLGKDNVNLPRENIYIHTVIEKIIANYTDLIDKKKFDVQILGNQYEPIYASPSLVEVIFNNLIRNALYYGKEILKINLDTQYISITNKIDTAPSAENKFGYGLEIVRRICELNGWYFYIETDDSNFIVRIEFSKLHNA